MLYKRKNSKFYWCRFTAPNGTEVRKSTKTAIKREAQEFEAAIKTELWRVHNLGDKPRKSWKQAAVKWIDESQHKATLHNDVTYLRYADKFLGSLYLDEINRSILDLIIESKLEEGVKNATVNRMMEVIRAILNAAEKKWDWLDKAPSVRMLAEPQRRIRWINVQEAQRLRTELPLHLAALMDFSLATGLREANAAYLEWSQVDLRRKVIWIHADQSKTRSAFGIPLNSEALNVLIAQRGMHPERVFTYKGNPIQGGNTKAWRKALKRAGIKDFRWHDLRHTWASWHIQNGTPIHVLKELGGWSDIKMVLKYAHLAPEHLAVHAENICCNEGVPDNVAHFPAHKINIS